MQCMYKCISCTRILSIVLDLEKDQKLMSEHDCHKILSILTVTQHDIKLESVMSYTFNQQFLISFNK